MKDPKITMDTVRAAVWLDRAKEAQPYYERDLLQAVRDVAALEALERRGRRLGERQCNGVPRYEPTLSGRMAVQQTWTEEDDAANERAWARIEAKAREIVAPYGVALRFSRDPCGSALRLVIKNQEYPL